MNKIIEMYSWRWISTIEAWKTTTLLQTKLIMIDLNRPWSDLDQVLISKDYDQIFSYLS